MIKRGGIKLKQLFLIFSSLLIFGSLMACDSKQEPSNDKSNKKNEVQKEDNQEAQIPLEESTDGDANEKNREKQERNDESIVEITQKFFWGKAKIGEVN